MADDIDDLLDEVENKYVERKKVSTDGSEGRSKQTKRNKLDDEINDILTDTHIDDGLDHRKKSLASAPVGDDTTKMLSESTKKCFPIYVGGSTHQPGQGTTVSQRACDRLRCTACDFKVCTFDNYKWASDTNYLFLRNNVPDFSKLKAKLSAAKGSRAYCCQCSWRTVKDLTQLNDPELKWVCGKH